MIVRGHACQVTAPRGSGNQWGLGMVAITQPPISLATHNCKLEDQATTVGTAWMTGGLMWTTTWGQHRRCQWQPPWSARRLNQWEPNRGRSLGGRWILSLLAMTVEAWGSNLLELPSHLHDSYQQASSELSADGTETWAETVGHYSGRLHSE